MSNKSRRRPNPEHDENIRKIAQQVPVAFELQHTESGGTYTDDEGYLRCVSNNAYAVWHNRGCPVQHVDKEEIIKDVNGEQWCPKCYEDREFQREAKKIQQLFATKGMSEVKDFS